MQLLLQLVYEERATLAEKHTYYGGERLGEMPQVSRAIQDGPKEPNFHDPEWRAFILALERVSEQSSQDWKRFRSALRRLKDEFHARLLPESVDREIAFCAFDCACWYQPDVRIVRAALRALLAHRLGVRGYVHATAEYRKWAKAHSPDDLTAAAKMIALAQSALERCDSNDRRELGRVLQRLVDENDG